ncbi:MAG: hypothetical protein ABW167_18515 [Baekduia sp.]
MTLPHLHRSSSTLARSALVAVVLASGAGAAASQERVDASSPPRTAVLAGADAPSAAVTAASQRAGSTVTVHHAAGILDAQAQATRLAAEGYDTVIGVGAQARAAVSQAAAGEVGDDTDWQIAAH